MRRIAKFTAWTLAVLIGLPILVVIAANTDPGRHLIEQQTAGLTGGMVRLSGLSGRFPDRLRVARLAVADAAGPYVTLDDVALDWSPTRLLTREALIDRLTASHITLARLPEASSSASGGTSNGGSSFSLPVRVVLRQLQVARVDIAATVAGTAMALSVDGNATLDTLTTGQARIALRQVDGPGRYTIDGALTADRVQATIKVSEPPDGLIASVAGVQNLGAIAVDATLHGPWSSVVTKLDASAGPLQAHADGAIDLTDQAADLTVSARAPAMTPRPDVSWQSVDLDARVHGAFTAPDATGTVRIAGLKAAGAAIGALNADIAGKAGLVTLKARASGLRLPGPRPDLLAGAPLDLDATARLNAPDRPVTFTLHHPRLDAAGSAQTAGAIQARIVLTIPDLAPFAAAGGVDLKGRTALTLTAAQHDDTTAVAVQGTIGITGGMPPVPALLGDAATLDLAATLHGPDVTLTRLTVNGKSLDVSASGGLQDQVLAADWSVHLAELAAVQPTLGGTLEAKGHAQGKLDDLAVIADLSGDISGRGYQSGHLIAHVDATGLPEAPRAKVTADGTLLDSPLAVALEASRQDGALRLTIDHADWKSAHASGALALAQHAAIPTGTLSLTMTRLADLAPLLGRSVAGSIEASIDADDSTARMTVSGKDISVPGTAALSRLALNASVDDPAGHPVLDGTLALDGLSAGAYGGAARVTARGPPEAVRLTVNASSPDVAGSAARLDTTGTLDATARSFALASMQAVWKQQALRLLAPSRIDFADGVAIDRLRLGLRQAVFDLTGRVGSTLDLTASLRNLPADLAAVVAPDYAPDGTIGAEVRLTGTTARPEGTIRITATGLHLRRGPGQALPVANMTANATLDGTNARVDTQVTAGRSKLAVTGTVPISASGPMDLHGNGSLDLAMLDPLLAAEGRRARGTLTLDAAIAGTAAAPRISGTARLANGDIQDLPNGVHITAVTALIEADGDTIRLTRLSAKAGPGTLGASGTIGLAGAMPVDLRFTADDARPLSSDLLTALIDADLTLRGDIKGALTAGGRLHVRRADIRVPDRLPASVAVIQVRTAGMPPPPPAPAATPLDLGLDLTLDAPEEVFIRGRGLDVELGGTIHIRGTAANPQPDGGLKLRRGTLSVVGQTLTFTQGAITFTGAGLTDPAINLVAQNVTTALTATVTVSGSARNPKITLSSVPDQPQDEILAALLFNTTTSKLSPFQMAEIAAALASLSGATSGIDPLASIRSTLGLDRLSVGSGTGGDPTLEAGKYLARGVYLGAKQSASGTGTQATVQIDLAKGLKLEATAGTGTSTATGSTGSADAASVGLTYQFEY